MDSVPVHSLTILKATRLVFVIVSTLLGVSIGIGYDVGWWLGALLGAAFGGLMILVDRALRNLTFRGFSHATVGLLIGLLCAWLITRIGFFETKGLLESSEAKSIFELAIYLALGFLGVMLALRSNKEEFSFIIPYVRFRQDAVQDQPLLADTSVVIDGRIPRICAAGFLGGSLIVPRFVLDDLHRLADSKDEVRSERGKRGLESLNRMQQSPNLDVSIQEDLQPGENGLDAKLIYLAKVLGARLLTNDVNLGKVARLQGLSVLNLNELAQAMRPSLTPGDELQLSLVKEGKDPHQAVGYLPDGTMIVVNHARERIGTTQDVIVAGAVQTSAGRLIFGELKDSERSEAFRAAEAKGE